MLFRSAERDDEAFGAGGGGEGGEEERERGEEEETPSNETLDAASKAFPPLRGGAGWGGSQTQCLALGLSLRLLAFRAASHPTLPLP